MAEVFVITTGGTIGGLAVEDVRRQPKIKDIPVGRDIVREALESEFWDWDTRCEAMEHRDSNHIDDAYREKLAEMIVLAPEKRVLVTHGTDTVLETADFLFRRDLRKSVIVTGAKVPLANGKESDGFRNIAYALACLRKATDTGKVGIVLCGYDSAKEWRPHLYLYEPERYARYIHPTDDRFCGIVVR
jgi:L-asparaginase